MGVDAGIQVGKVVKIGLEAADKKLEAKFGLTPKQKKAKEYCDMATIGARSVPEKERAIRILDKALVIINKEDPEADIAKTQTIKREIETKKAEVIEQINKKKEKEVEKIERDEAEKAAREEENMFEEHFMKSYL